MSEMLQPVDVAKIAVGGFAQTAKIILKDLNALPEEAFTRQFGEKTRTVADIIFEINMVNDHIGMVIRDEEPFEWPDSGWIKAPADFATKADVIAAFEKSCNHFRETLESFSPEQLVEKIKTEDGETDRFERARFASWHMIYHSGQFNFIQTLLGDDAWNW